MQKIKPLNLQKALISIWEERMKSKILVVDDEPLNLQLLRQILEDTYRLVYATDGEKAYNATVKHNPDLILMDIMMPNMDGYEACRKLKANPEISKIPVIFITSMGEIDDEKLGFDIGAVDYIIKPINGSILKRRIQTHLSLVRMDELEKTQLIIIQRLGRAAEYKDNETGLHVIRMSYYCRIIAEKIGRSESWCKMIFQASPMHDIGKIGVPDNILLKPGPLNEEEKTIMEKHPKDGYDIIGYHQSRLLQMAAEIALSHHEKWDGTGYPNKLIKDEIPFSGRVVAVADVFDALTSDRPYKDEWSVEKAVGFLNDQSGIHFDPVLIDAFNKGLADILDIKEKWSEKSSDQNN
ncbi:MAG: response regulator [Desulfobacterales bacterium]|nr:response regulator [Desulfobacterales bacterium]MCP4160269.1 response regulator [Deltaproteobacteria bacterium]